ncbi:MAG: 3-keto-disaccharide hydrolase [Planctomycetota bacterium]
MMRMFLLALMAPSLDPAQGSAPNTLTEAEKAQGWRLLFDGKTTAGWRGFKQTSCPAGWKVVDGALGRTAQAGDIVTEEEFESFELSLEWKVAKGGNSGIFFGVSEDHGSVWETGPEFQVLDNALHKDGGDPKTSAGANYALHAPAKDATRPPGEWNVARIRVEGAKVEHWLNGVKLLSYELGSAEWKALVGASKFKSMPDYGTRRRGRLALQDHGDSVEYRSIKIRTLGGAR